MIVFFMSTKIFQNELINISISIACVGHGTTDVYINKTKEIILIDIQNYLESIS